MAEYKKVASLTDVKPNTATLIEVNGRKIALFNLNGDLFGIDDECPHEGGPLSEGSVEGDSVSCPWHGSVFNIKTGAVEAPPAVEGVRRYNVRVRGLDIEVEV
jgi:3-phenylpropionate/trans-cinnamate dioxygenase ferredoxin subunit